MIENTLAQPLFDLQNVFDVEDYMFAYQDELTPERTDREAALLARLLGEDGQSISSHSRRIITIAHKPPVD